MLEAARESVRVEPARGKKIARIHLWHFMTPRMSDLLAQSLDGSLHDADALLLDVRGRGGQALVIQRVLANFKGDHPRWRRPVTALIDGETRSAKEIFAWAFHRDGLGKLVGERTKGAVIGCQFEKLFDGSVLMLPVQDVRGMTQGEQLEGAGVEPDVKVDEGPLPYRHGRDRIAERGIEVTLDRLAERAQHKYR
jgi:carboxyl-terminal processing protease